MNPDGTGIRQLTPRVANDPAWSPDGSKIAFDTTWSNGSSSVVWMKADGGGVHLVARNAVSPTWSPDGSKIAFDAFAIGGEKIMIADVTGRGRRRVVSKNADDPSWSPDGHQIAFVVAAAGPGGVNVDGSDIRVVNVDGSGMKTLARDDDPNHEWNGFPVWSPDGRRIAFVEDFDDGSGYDQVGVVVIPVRLVRSWPGTIGIGLPDRPEWSPDGSGVIYGNGNNGQIYETTTHGRSIQITHGGMWKAEPAWSPLLR